MRTTGVSVIAARPRASVIRQKPPPEVAVIALRPAYDAPMTMLRAAISLSGWMTTMSFSRSWAAR